MEAYYNSDFNQEHHIADADRTIEIDQIRREDVVQQLKLLGYNNVPDFLVQEFLDELRMSLSSSRHLKNENEYESDSTDGDDRNNQQTRDIHLHGDGYESVSSSAEEHDDYNREQYHFNRPQVDSSYDSGDEKTDQEEFRHQNNTHHHHEYAKHSNDNENDSSYYEEEEEGEYEDENEEQSDGIDHRDRGKGLYMYPPAVTQSLAHHAGYHRNLDERYQVQDRNITDEEDGITPAASASNSHSSKHQAYEKTQFIAQQNNEREWSHGEDGHIFSETDTVDSRDSMNQPLAPPVYMFKRNIPTREERKPEEQDPKLAQLQREKEELEKRKAFLERQLLQQQQQRHQPQSQQSQNSNSHTHVTREHLSESPSSRAPSTARSTTSTSSTQSPRSSVVRYSHSGFGGRKPLSYRKKIHDPVSRYKQLQNVWQKDNFLADHGSRKSLRWQVRQEMLQISGDTYASNL